jgi:methyl-accepting chemotaxis protein
MINLNLERKIADTLKNGKLETENQLIQLQKLVDQIAIILDSVQNVSHTLGAHTDSVSNTMDKVKEINSSINKISTEAKNHSVSVNQLSTAIERTKDVFQKNIVSVDKLKQSAKDVFNVISVIEDVTEQTNLLAINASIEASHAGDFGKGFMVVANEIKTLAEKTTENSKKIKEMLDITNEDLQEVDVDMKKTVNEFENITSVADTVNYALSSILEGSSKVAFDATQISDIISDLISILRSTNAEMNEIGRKISESTMAFSYMD